MRGSVKKDETRGTWFFVVDNGIDPATGKRRQHKQRGFATRKEAENKLNERLGAGEWVEPSAQPLRAFLKEWLATIERTVKPSTFGNYRSKLERHVSSRIGATPLSAVDPGTLNGLYADLLEAGLAPPTVAIVHRILHRAFRDAARWGRLARNPADFCDPPKQRRPKADAWTADELRGFVSAVSDDRLRGLWILAATTGMRRGELCGLRWEDVTLDAGQLAVRRSRVPVRGKIHEVGTKSGEARTIALDAATVSELGAHRTRQLEERLAWGPAWTDTGYVFTIEDGRPIRPDRVTRMFNEHVANAALRRIRFHGLRHTHATLALANGVPAKVVQERLGHASVAFTLSVYAHVVPGMQEDAAAKLGALILGG